MHRDFETHRCDKMPRGFSLRRYKVKQLILPDAGGWVLGRHAWDSEWCCDYLDNVTPYAREHVNFCPWCGRDLKGGA